MAEDETRAVGEVSQRLSATFPGMPAAVVRDTVQHYHQQFAGRPIRDFVPVLVERMARTSLAAYRTPRHAEATDPIPQQHASTSAPHPPGSGWG